MENLNIALLLMIVGMATVFAILLIVIYLGKGLIALVNKYAPEEVVPAKQAANAPLPVIKLPSFSTKAAVYSAPSKYFSNPG